MRTELLIPTFANTTISLHDISREESPSTWGWHMHNECELFLAIDGEKTFTVYEHQYVLKKGDIIFINEKVPHKSETPHRSVGFLIQFGTAHTERHMSNALYHFASLKNDAVAVFKNGTKIQQQLKESLEKIIEENTKRHKCYDMFIKAEVYKILAVLYRSETIKNPTILLSDRSISKILPVLNYIDTHFREQITLEQASRLLNVNKFHFCRMFKNLVNTTFMQYLNYVRICEAEHLLLISDKTISEIAGEVGFSSATYFAETFKSITTYSPRAYRKIKLEENKTTNIQKGDLS